MKRKIIYLGTLLIFTCLLFILDIVLKSHENPAIAMTIDGESVNSIPSSGYYDLVSYSCDNTATVTWDKYKRKISFSIPDSSVGSNHKQSCTLNFATASTFLLNTVNIGDYVLYSGSNGCSASTSSLDTSFNSQCKGMNVNYVNSDDMGYCGDSNFKYYTTGWRIAYFLDSNSDGILEPYIVTAGSPSCVTGTAYNGALTTTTEIVDMKSENIYYATGFTYDSSTGYYSLNSSSTVVQGVYSNVYNTVNNYYTCINASLTGKCSTLYKIQSFQVTTYANAYKKVSGNSASNISSLNTEAIKYCNSNYAYGGGCQTTYNTGGSNYNTWSLKGLDFYQITSQLFGEGRRLFIYDTVTENATGTKCSPYVYSTKECGYNNDLIDNGGNYWFASAFSENNTIYRNSRYRYITNDFAPNVYGDRVVVHLKQNIYVTSGSGTQSDPYIIHN